MPSRFSPHRWHERLRQAVKESGRTQADIARAAGLPEETVSRIITGESRNPKFETVCRITHAIGATVGWLLEERGYSLSRRQIARLQDAALAIGEATPE